MYINLLHLPQFNFAYLFFLSFLSFLFSQRLLLLFSLLYSPSGSLLYCYFPVCALVSFVLVDIIFGFLSRSIYCTLFLLVWFYFAYGCICKCVYSATLFIVVINLCLYLCWVSAVLWSSLFLPVFLFFFHILFSLLYSFNL